MCIINTSFDWICEAFLFYVNANFNWKIFKIVIVRIQLKQDIRKVKKNLLKMKNLLKIQMILLFTSVMSISHGQTKVEEVWPGDANNDGVVNIDDIYLIGRYWDEIGPERVAFLDSIDENFPMHHLLYFANDTTSVGELYDDMIEVEFEVWDEEEDTIYLESLYVMDTIHFYSDAIQYFDSLWYEENLFWDEEESDYIEYFLEDDIWYSEVAESWREETEEGTDLAHVDANGDGRIDERDVYDVYYYYQFDEDDNRSSREDGVHLNVSYNKDSLVAGEEIEIDLSLADNTITDLYGMSIRFELNPEVVNIDESGVFMDETAFGGEGEIIPFAVMNPVTHKVDFAIVRNTGTGKTAIGSVAKIKTIIEDDLAGEIEKLDLNISNIELVAEDGSIVPVSVVDEGLPTHPSSVSIKKQQKIDDLIMYPNPTDNILNIAMNLDKVQKLEIVNAIGEVVYSQEDITQQNLKLDVSKYHTGIYFVQFYGDNVYGIKRVIIK